MHLILALLISLSFPAMAEVYKWTDASGQVHFGSQPPPGKKQQVDIRESSPGAMGSSRQYESSESDIIRQARDLESRKQQQAYERAQERYRHAVEGVRSSQQDSPDYVCTGVKDRLKSANERFHNAKMQGLTISEKNYHEQRIKDLERHRDNICR